MMNKEELKKWHDTIGPILEETRKLKTKEELKAWMNDQKNDEKIKVLVNAFIQAMAHAIKPIFEDMENEDQKK